MQIFNTKIKLTEDLLGTVPYDKAIYATYIESKKPETEKEDETETVEEMERSGWTGFHKDSKGLFVYDYLIRGFIRNAANVLKDQIGVKNLRSKITDYVFVMPRRVYFGKYEADGILERPIRVMTMKGPRVSLVRSDFITAGTTLTFEIHMLEKKEITEKLIRALLEYGQYQGLGQFRNGSYGRFEVLQFG